MKWSSLIPKEAADWGKTLQDTARAEHSQGVEICPPPDQIFRALNTTPPEKVKVCLVGQDPYHTPGQANGLAFSVAPGNPIQPSLVNIFKELEDDLGIPRPDSGDLTKWAENGVLLLNTSLTVEAHRANSHAGWHWDRFTTAILQAATRLPQPVVFLLWGLSAQGLLKNLLSSAATYEGNIVRERLIKKAYILSSHPSPFSARKGAGGYPPFIGSHPFSTANNILVEMGNTPVDWSL